MGRRKRPKGGGRAGIKIPLSFSLLFSSGGVCRPSHLLKEKGHGHLLRTYSNDCGGIKGSPFYLTEKLRLKGYNTIPRDTEQLNKSFLQNLPEPRLPFYDKSFGNGPQGHAALSNSERAIHIFPANLPDSESFYCSI